MARKRRYYRKKNQPMIYIGPNLAGGVLARGTVFRNGLPDHVQRVVADTPAIAALIVPVADLPAARSRLARHGKEAQAYRALTSNHGGKK